MTIVVRTPFLLNENVKRELRENPELLPTFLTFHLGYDEDIDPTFNPDFVARARERETQILADVRKIHDFAGAFTAAYLV